VLQKIASGKGDSLIKLRDDQHDEDMNYPSHLRASIKEFMAMYVPLPKSATEILIQL
jgi:hypothetical protein